VVNCGYKKWLYGGFFAELVVEAQPLRIFVAEFLDLRFGLSLRCRYFCACLLANRFYFLPISVGLAGRDIVLEKSLSADAGLIFRFNENLQVRLCVRFVADLGEEKRINVTARGDEIQIGADTGLAG